ncbi:hypothetical protein ABW19_dt0203327 [Dactylella cylindrospora]|nr:hypothetical protein ABW19_dt0203327 [Dactylella cylindrospora]
MRIYSILAFGLVALRTVAAECECLERAANAVNCDVDDESCLCDSGSDYIEALNTCSQFSINDCTDRELNQARSDFARACLREETTTTARSSTRTTSTRESSTTTSSSRTTSSPATTTTESSTSASSTAAATSTASPTNTAAPSSGGGGSKLSTAQIGGIAGGAAGAIVLLILLTVFCTMRKYKKIDKKEEVERAENADKFIEGGRQFRAVSMTLNPNDRLYSTQRPLSYALGEYNSSRYDGDREHSPDGFGRHLSPDDTPINSTTGGYFNRFSGNYVEDSSQAFENRNSQGYNPPSGYGRGGQRAASVPSGGPVIPTASLSYEEYRNRAHDNAGERTSLIIDDNASTSSSAPHRSVSAPMSQRISRKPIVPSASPIEPSGSNYYPTQAEYQNNYQTDARSPLMEYDNNRRLSFQGNRHRG